MNTSQIRFKNLTMHNSGIQTNKITNDVDYQHSTKQDKGRKEQEEEEEEIDKQFKIFFIIIYIYEIKSC